MENEIIGNASEISLDVPTLYDECGDTLWDVVFQQAKNTTKGVKPSNSLGKLPPDKD